MALNDEIAALTYIMIEFFDNSSDAENPNHFCFENPENLPSNFTALLYAMFNTYMTLTGRTCDDIIDFTYLLNRLAILDIQDFQLLKNNEENSDDIMS